MKQNQKRQGVFAIAATLLVVGVLLVTGPPQAPTNRVVVLSPSGSHLATDGLVYPSSPYRTGGYPNVGLVYTLTDFATLTTPEDRGGGNAIAGQNWNVTLSAIAPDYNDNGSMMLATGFTVNSSGFFTPVWSALPLYSAGSCSAMGKQVQNNHGVANNGATGFTLNRYTAYNFTITVSSNRTWVTFAAHDPTGATVWSHGNTTVALANLDYGGNGFVCPATGHTTHFYDTQVVEYVAIASYEAAPLWSFPARAMGYVDGSGATWMDTSAWNTYVGVSAPAHVNTYSSSGSSWPSYGRLLIANEKAGIFFGDHYNPIAPGDSGTLLTDTFPMSGAGTVELVVIEYAPSPTKPTGAYSYTTMSTIYCTPSNCGVGYTGMLPTYWLNITVTSTFVGNGWAWVSIYWGTGTTDFTEAVIATSAY